jgi:hypothetical protein
MIAYDIAGSIRAIVTTTTNAMLIINLVLMFLLSIVVRVD